MLLIFLKPLIKLLDLFIPKNKHEILFYGYQGSYRGNVKYFFEYLLHYKNPLIIPIWISKDETKLVPAILTKLKKLLDECRSGFLFLPDD